jgi:hypothetical protein
MKPQFGQGASKTSEGYPHMGHSSNTISPKKRKE